MARGGLGHISRGSHMSSNRMRALRRAVRICVLAAASLCAAMTGAEARLIISKKTTANVVCTAGTCVATAANAVLNATEFKNLADTGCLAGAILFDAPLTLATVTNIEVISCTGIDIERPIVLAGTGQQIHFTTNDGGSGGFLSFGRNGKLDLWDLGDTLSIDGANY